jgi:hypothetical protein
VCAPSGLKQVESCDDLRPRFPGLAVHEQHRVAVVETRDVGEPAAVAIPSDARGIERQIEPIVSLS